MPKTRKLLLALHLAALAPLLTACAHDPLNADASQFERVPLPVTPEGEAQCDDDNDGKSEPCLSEAQRDYLFNAVIDVACEANDRLAHLSDYYLGTNLGPSCGLP